MFFCRASYWVSFPSSNSSQLLENRCIGRRPRATMRGVWFLLKSEDDYLFPLESEANPCLCLHRRNKLFFVPVVACPIETSAGKLAIITVYPFQAWSMHPSQASILEILPPPTKKNRKKEAKTFSSFYLFHLPFYQCMLLWVHKGTTCYNSAVSTCSILAFTAVKGGWGLQHGSPVEAGFCCFGQHQDSRSRSLWMLCKPQVL